MIVLNGFILLLKHAVKNIRTKKNILAAAPNNKIKQLSTTLTEKIHLNSQSIHYTGSIQTLVRRYIGIEGN